MQLTIKQANDLDIYNLFKWRNDPETRKNSINAEEVSWEDHVEWFRNSLLNPNREILIFWADYGTASKILFKQNTNLPVGTVRADQIHKKIIELSWTVSPPCRGQGIGKAIVSGIFYLYSPGHKFIAKIKSENKPSIKIAEYCGMKLTTTDNNILTYERNPEDE